MLTDPRPTTKDGYLPAAFDRPCDVCHKPMIGVIKGDEAPIRMVCDPCGGRPLTVAEREGLNAVRSKAA